MMDLDSYRAEYSNIIKTVFCANDSIAQPFFIWVSRAYQSILSKKTISIRNLGLCCPGLDIFEDLPVFTETLVIPSQWNGYLRSAVVGVTDLLEPIEHVSTHMPSAISDHARLFSNKILTFTANHPIDQAAERNNIAVPSDMVAILEEDDLKFSGLLQSIGNSWQCKLNYDPVEKHIEYSRHKPDTIAAMTLCKYFKFFFLELGRLKNIQMVIETQFMILGTYRVLIKLASSNSLQTRAVAVFSQNRIPEYLCGKITVEELGQAIEQDLLNVHTGYFYNYLGRPVTADFYSGLSEFFKYKDATQLSKDMCKTLLQNKQSAEIYINAQDNNRLIGMLAYLINYVADAEQLINDVKNRIFNLRHQSVIKRWHFFFLVQYAHDHGLQDKVSHIYNSGFFNYLKGRSNNRINWEEILEQKSHYEQFNELRIIHGKWNAHKKSIGIVKLDDYVIESKIKHKRGYASITMAESSI